MTNVDNSRCGAWKHSAPIKLAVRREKG